MFPYSGKIDEYSIRTAVQRLAGTSSSRVHVSNSGTQAKFGTKCNHNWPTRSYQICIRAGPQSMLSFLLLSVYFILSLLFSLDFSANLGLPCMQHPSIEPLAQCRL